MILSHIDRFDYVPTRVYWNNKMFSFVFKRVWMYWAMHQCWTVKRHAERCHHVVQLNTPITCNAHLAVTLDHPQRFQKYSLSLMFIKANPYVKFRPRKRAKNPPVHPREKTILLGLPIFNFPISKSELYCENYMCLTVQLNISMTWYCFVQLINKMMV